MLKHTNRCFLEHSPSRRKNFVKKRKPDSKIGVIGVYYSSDIKNLNDEQSRRNCISVKLSSLCLLITAKYIRRLSVIKIYSLPIQMEYQRVFTPNSHILMISSQQPSFGQ